MRKILCISLLTLAGIIGLCHQAQAAEEELAPGFSQCMEKAESTAASIECLTAAYKHWDKILNENFKKAKAACKDSEHSEKCDKDLMKAQKFWIQYKEAMFPVIEELHGGGSMSRMMADEFAASETKKQAQLLQPE